jgi:hypothetical protein
LAGLLLSSVSRMLPPQNLGGKKQKIQLSRYGKENVLDI